MAAKKKTEAAARFPKATEKDFTVIVKPLITEKTMALMQNENKVTVKVLDSANKTEIKFDEKKTKNFVNFLDAIKVGGKALIVVDEITEEIFASSRNVGFAKVVTSDNISVVDLLNVDNLVMSKASIKAVEEALK